MIGHPLIRPLTQKDTLLSDQISDALRWLNTTKLSSYRKATSFIRPVFHGRFGGLIREGLL
jgi:hypothetical protein